MRIGIDGVTPGLSITGSSGGGMRMYLTAITTGMHDCDDNAEFILFENPQAPLSELRSLTRLGVTTCPRVPRTRTWRVLYQNSVYPLLMRSSPIQVLLATCNVVPVGTPVPTVLVMQSIQYFDQVSAFGTLHRRYLQSAVTSSVMRAQAVICLSHAARRALVELTGVDPEKLHVVYHGLPPSHNATLTRAKGTLTATTAPYILNVSSLHRYKNTLRLIEAYARLRRAHRIPQHLRIIGNEAAYTRRDIYRFASTLGVADSVEFLGPIPHEDLPLHYATADLFVYPSLYETFGLPPLEAMAAGCAVVASNSSSIPEVVGGAAELVDALDVDSIASGMLNVLANPSRRAELVVRGRKRAAEFTWDRAGRQTLDILVQAAETVNS